ncbi:hypothetical protein DM01DRAFT_1314804 [Hesseltinella vesiculosa]|uniref:Mitochondrial zinc maintenance protein 1, mitochondrial n=1 Tax=Hesseltinella vesiculosa TaxID=101127 RepID=A0A1X2GZG3_9FUNG|nr:hypothetical protein DM01DRAFT_1314804 [Hesseltinella vesiculosa]
MATPSKQAAISAYRNLLKTQKQVFGNDLAAVEAARKETYARFMQNKNEANTDVLEEKLALANQVATLLRRNVVQAESADGGELYKLHITKDTELGDNDSIKKAMGSHRKNRKPKKTACCGGH